MCGLPSRPRCGFTALLVFAALSPQLTSGQTPCIDRLKGMVADRDPLLLSYGLATGKQLPRDAGKYWMCEELPNSRYFLADVTIQDNRTFASNGISCEIGLCLPDVCRHSDVLLLFLGVFSHLIPSLPDIEASDVSSTSPSLDIIPVDMNGYIALLFICLLVFWIMVSTALVCIGRRRAPVAAAGSNSVHLEVEASGSDAQVLDPTRVARLPWLVEAFSLIGNNGTLTKLIESLPYKQTDGLNGMRVLSMLWIILGHTFLMPTGVSGYTNYEDIVVSPLRPYAAEYSPAFMLIVASENGVDTFFFLSGFLLSFLTLKELASDSGKLNPFQAVAMRYIRLTPNLAVAMLIYYKIAAFSGSGPFAVRLQDSIMRRCDTSWWSELLYTMNFLPFDSDKVCMGWTWYLGDDMIFFVLGILILRVFFWRRYLGWLAAISLMAASGGLTVWLIVKYNLSVYVFDDHYKRYSYYAYSKPYTRIGAYLIGLVSAWILDEMCRRGFTRESLKLQRGASRLGFFLLCCSLLVFSFLIFIPTTDFGNGKNSWGVMASVLYLGFARQMWAASVAIITFSCYFQLLPSVEGFLSHPIWTPLTRLTYGAYLCHPIVIKLMAGRESQYYVFTVQDCLYRFIGNCIYSYGAAAVLWCLIERPMMTIMGTIYISRKSARSIKPARCLESNS